MAAEAGAETADGVAAKADSGTADDATANAADEDSRDAAADAADGAAGTLTDALQQLAQINALTVAARAELAAVQHKLAQARQALGESRAAQLLEANESLVLAALQAQSAADTAQHDLEALSDTTQRDSVTNLPNRALMFDRLESAIALAYRRRTRLAVMFVDLDGFKKVNDAWGHRVGDSALRAAAACLSAAVRHSDTVSRHGGDEFLVLLTELGSAADAAHVAAKILSMLEEPGRFSAPVLRLSASVGIALYPEHGLDAATLIDRADVAMYRAKLSGGARLTFHGD